MIYIYNGSTNSMNLNYMDNIDNKQYIQLNKSFPLKV